MQQNKLNIKIILGSTRPDRFSEYPGKWISEILKGQTDIEAEILDLRDYPMPFFSESETPSSKTKPYTHEAVVRWTGKIAEADGFIIVAPEYNHGYPGVLKNAFDYVYQEWNKKPIGFVTYGSAMGARSVEQLRAVAVELQMAPIRNAIHMPWSTVVAVEKEGPDKAFGSYAEKAKDFIDQLSWWAKALKVARLGA